MDHLKPSFLIEDDRFEVSDLSEKELFLEFQRTKFVFIVKCLKFKEIQWLEEYAIPFDFSLLKNLFESHPFIKANFWSKIHVIYHPLNKAIVPIDYFKANREVALLPNFDSRKENDAFGNFKVTQQSYLIYHKEEGLIQFLEEAYPNKKLNIIPMDVCLVKIPNCTVMHFEENVLTFQILKSGEILQSRIIQFDSLKRFKDIISTLKLDFKRELILTGEITSYSGYYTWLNVIFEKVSFGRKLGNVRISQFFSEVPKHKYISILNASVLA